LARRVAESILILTNVSRGVGFCGVVSAARDIAAKDRLSLIKPPASRGVSDFRTARERRQETLSALGIPPEEFGSRNVASSEWIVANLEVASSLRVRSRNSIRVDKSQKFRYPFGLAGSRSGTGSPDAGTL
jgi:hypothetical protein